MLEKIKSEYYLKILFSFLGEKRKLQLANYNKKLQIKLDKTVYNYMIFSGKYIIFETNIKGKIFNAYSDQLIFEGEFLNGKKNGKGKEYYDNGNLQFEGEYLNGKRNGKGKEYNNNGTLKYEGEYLNDKRHGIGKEYEYGKLIFYGEFVNNLKWKGKGGIYGNEGNMIIENEYINGKLWSMKEYNEDYNIINEIHEGNGLIKNYNSHGILIS